VAPSSWHTLLGPLPDAAVPERGPVGPPEVLARPDGAAIAGWEQLTLHLSAAAAGLRAIQVVLDAADQLVAASDHVLFRSARLDGVADLVQESVGGRFETDGSFRGTRWHGTAVERPGDDDTEWQLTKSEPSDADVERLRTLVAEIRRRGPARAASC